MTQEAFEKQAQALRGLIKPREVSWSFIKTLGGSEKFRQHLRASKASSFWDVSTSFIGTVDGMESCR